MNEEWKQIIGYEGIYSVSNTGHIRRDVKSDRAYAGRLLNPTPDGCGYLQVCLYKDNAGRAIKVHKLVCLMFLGVRPEGMEINHKDGDKLNNFVENLEYVTHKQNMHHAQKNGLIRRLNGHDVSSSKLTEADVNYIKNAFINKESPTKLAKLYSVNRSTIYRVGGGVYWKHLLAEKN